MPEDDNEQPDSEALLAELADCIPSMLGYWDESLRCRFANQAYRTWFGVSPANLIGKPIQDLLGPIYELNRPFIEGVLRGEPQRFERTIPDPGGGPPRFALAEYLPDVKDDKVKGFFVLVSDVTALKRLEKSFAESEKRWETLFSILPVGVSIVEASGVIREANPALERILGMSREAMLRGEHRRRRYITPDGENLPPDRFATSRARASGGPSQTDIGVVKEDGSTVWTSVIAAPLPSEPSACVVVTKDVTERRAAELATQQNAARLGALLDATVDGLVTIDEKHRITLVNKAVVRLFGYEAHELIGKSVGLLMPEATRREHEAYILRYEETGIPRIIGKGREVVGQRKDGAAVHLFLSVASLPPEAAVGKYVATLHDITARKAAEAERKILEDHLRQSEKLHAVGRLAGGVAHDFNNLLTVITMSAEILSDKLGTTSPMHDELVQILDAASRASALTSQLLTFGRPGLVSRTTVDLASVIARLHPMLRRLIPANIAIELDAATATPIEADLSQIEQVIMNLALNARDAMPRGGTLQIAIHHANAPAAFRAPLTSESCAVLVVRDTGVGMSKATIARVFEPFFTTKEAGQGTGLGLATVYGIVRETGGSIEIDSAVGAGTTFTVRFPLVASQRPKEVTPRPTAAQGTATILVVEDEGAILRLAALVLGQRGHRVLTAVDAEAALALVATFPDRIDLLFTDVIMPGMSGPELGARLKARQPAMKILYASGYPDDVLFDQGEHPDRMHFIAKPYSLDALCQKVSEILTSTYDPA